MERNRNNPEHEKDEWYRVIDIFSNCNPWKSMKLYEFDG